MGLRIVMIPDVETWLADVRCADPSLANEADVAVAFLRAGGPDVGAPLVVPPDRALGVMETDPRSGGSSRGRRARSRPRRMLVRARIRLGLACLDGPRRRHSTVLTQLRRAAADSAVARQRLELRVGDLDTDLHTALRSREADIATATRRLKAKLAAFEHARQAIEAACLEAVEAAEAAQDQLTVRFRGKSVNPPAISQFWLRELRSEASKIRILFTVEPPDTAVLLAVGAEQDWLRSWHAEVVPLCRLRYTKGGRGT